MLTRPDNSGTETLETRRSYLYMNLLSMVLELIRRYRLKKVFRGQGKELDLILIVLLPVVVHHQALVVHDGFKMHWTTPERVDVFDSLAGVATV
jgi:hypothetical protein